MPRKKDAVVLGHADCPTCDKKMAVLQNTRGYLYSRCDDCGADQRNGKAVQTRLWRNTNWIGEPPTKPRNVPDDVPESTGDVPEKEPVQSVQKPVHEPEQTPIGDALEGEWQPAEEVPEKESGGGAFWVVGAVVVGLMGAVAGLRQ